MIDRLWYVWQLRQGINNISPELLPLVLQPFGLTVRDVLNVNALGYEYAVSKVVIS
jgi:tyrosinase